MEITLNPKPDRMTRFNHLLSKTVWVESITGTVALGTGSAVLVLFEVLTPILAFLGAVIAIVSGLYTLKTTRMKYAQMKKEISDYKANQNKSNDQI